MKNVFYFYLKPKALFGQPNTLETYNKKLKLYLLNQIVGNVKNKTAYGSKLYTLTPYMSKRK